MFKKDKLFVSVIFVELLHFLQRMPPSNVVKHIPAASDCSELFGTQRRMRKIFKAQKKSHEMLICVSYRNVLMAADSFQLNIFWEISFIDF